MMTKDTGILIRGPNISVVSIPKGVLSISHCAFNGCEAITAIQIPDSVQAIDDYAFSGCSGLLEMTIPDGVSEIGDYVFSGCSKLANVTIPDSVQTIGNYAFYWCEGLVALTIPRQVTSIGNDAFCFCKGLQSLTIPANVRCVKKGAFANCTGLTELVIENGVEEIEEEAFMGSCASVALTIPPSVTTIGQAAFSPVDKVNIQDLSAWCQIDFHHYQSNPLSMGARLYLNDKEIIYLDIPQGVETIKRYAFWNANRILTVRVPSSVTNIGESAFYKCDQIREVKIDNLSAWCQIDFESATANPLNCAKKLCFADQEIVDLNVPEDVSGIGRYAFYNCAGLQSVMMPNGVAEIGEKAFEGCYNINSVTMPGRFSLKIVFPSCFSRIREVRILDGEKELEHMVFADCKGLEKVLISEGVTRLGEDLFYGLANLKEVTIPSTVTSIGGYALYGCTSLEVIHVSNDGDIDALKQMLYESGFDVESVTFDHVEEPVYAYYKVTFDAQGGVAKWTQAEVREGKPVGELPAVERDGYEFLGWFTSAVGGTQVTSATVVTKDVTFYAHWKRVSSGADEEIVAGEKVTIETGFIGYKAGGLPSGLKYDAKSGKITGTAKSATALEGVVVKFTKKNAASEEITIAVRAEDVSVGCEGLSNGPLPAGVVGASEGIDLQIYSEGGTKSVSVSKLPAGMKYDSKKGVITGAPSKAGNYEVVLTVTTKFGTKETVRIPVSVAAMPVMAVGTFTGFVSVGEDNLGTFTLTTTDAGKLTAKVVTAAGTVSFSGTCWDAVEKGVYRATLTTKKGEKLTLTLDSTAAWDANQLSGEFTTAEIAATKKAAAVPSRTYSVSAQRNAFGKTWYFAATGDETTGWKLAYTEDTKGAALTVTLKADGSTSIAGKLPNGTDTKGKAVTIKVSASGYANVGGLKDGAILVDFAPVLAVNKVKTVLAITTNLWFDRKNEVGRSVGAARFVK